MSANTDTTTGPTADNQTERLDELEDQLGSALDRIEELEATVEKQSETIENQSNTIQDLEAKLAAAHGKARTNRDLLVGPDEPITDDHDEFVAQEGGILPQLMVGNTGVLGKLRDQIQGEMQMRSQETSQLKLRISSVADAAGVEIDDSSIMDDDKIRRAMREGPEAVESRVYDVHERAVSLLRNMDDVGTLTNDSTWGRRFTVKTPAAKAHFRQARNEDLTSTEVKRVFRKIEDWAASSPRKVSTDTSGDVNKMSLQTEAQE